MRNKHYFAAIGLGLLFVLGGITILKSGAEIFNAEENQKNQNWMGFHKFY